MVDEYQRRTKDMPRKKEETTDVAVKEEEEESAMTAWGAEGEEDGWEDTSDAELSIPFLQILQSNSPQVEQNDPEDSRAGMIFNTVTREIVDGDEGLIFLPCFKEGPVWVEWIPRHQGGGFVGLHQAGSDAVKNAVPFIDPQTNKPTRRLRIGDNDLIETYYMYGLVLDEAGEERIGFGVINFTSTKIRPYRAWVTAMITLRGRPPLFAHRARIKTVMEKNPAGTYYNYRIEPLKKTWGDSLINPKTQAELLEKAKAFRELVKSGAARAAFDSELSAESGGGGGGASTDDDEPPF